MISELVQEVHLALADNANPSKAEGMRAYMKSAIPFRGVQTPVRHRLLRALLRAHPISEKSDWQAAVLELWRNVAYREERYAALDLAGAGRYESFRTLDTLPMFEEMVMSGA